MVDYPQLHIQVLDTQGIKGNRWAEPCSLATHGWECCHVASHLVGLHFCLTVISSETASFESLTEVDDTKTVSWWTKGMIVPSALRVPEPLAVGIWTAVQTRCCHCLHRFSLQHIQQDGWESSCSYLGKLTVAEPSWSTITKHHVTMINDKWTIINLGNNDS